ncbi:hypothetical protein BSLG_006577 [Batrachochytrium salamandrivorans]|nr:hypothetical protein BSLG_006577 [Batrachochytrium salamandrivorans]
MSQRPSDADRPQSPQARPYYQQQPQPPPGFLPGNPRPDGAPILQPQQQQYNSQYYAQQQQQYQNYYAQQQQNYAGPPPPPPQKALLQPTSAPAGAGMQRAILIMVALLTSNSRKVMGLPPQQYRPPGQPPVQQHGQQPGRPGYKAPQQGPVDTSANQGLQDWDDAASESTGTFMKILPRIVLDLLLHGANQGGLNSAPGQGASGSTPNIPTRSYALVEDEGMDFTFSLHTYLFLWFGSSIAPQKFLYSDALPKRRIDNFYILTHLERLHPCVRVHVLTDEPYFSKTSTATLVLNCLPRQAQNTNVHLNGTARQCALPRHDWVLHLDEESVIDDESIKAALEFVWYEHDTIGARVSFFTISTSFGQTGSSPALMLFVSVMIISFCSAIFILPCSHFGASSFLAQ